MGRSKWKNASEWKKFTGMREKKKDDGDTEKTGKDKRRCKLKRMKERKDNR